MSCILVGLTSFPLIWGYHKNDNIIGMANVVEILFLINSLRPIDAYMCQQYGPSLVQIVACHLFGAKPLSEPMVEYWSLDP